MADLGVTFDPNTIPESNRSFDPIPEGIYLLHVIDSDVVRTRDGNGQILKITCEVVDGPFSNRKVFENLNIANLSAKAQEIAQRALADLCLATGVGSIRDSEELHHRPFLGHVGVEVDKSGQYPPKNRIKRYRPAQATPPAGKAAPTRPAAVETAPAQQQTGAGNGGGTRPWNRRPTTPAA